MKVKFDEGYYEKALRASLKNERIEVLRADNDFFAAKGVNFLSNMFKVRLVYRINDGDLKTMERPIHLMVKSLPNELFVLKMVRDQELFNTELKALGTVLTRIEEFVHRPIGPKLLYGSLEDYVLIMEDLGVKGFVMKDRQEGLSLAHSAMLIEHLATLHAGSVAAFEKDPETISSFAGGIVSPNCPPTFIRVMEVSLENISEALRNWEDENCARTADKLRELAKTIGERTAKVYEHDYDEFCVLNHGDCWTNNIMFKEDEDGNPRDVLLVDFQMMIYTSPAVDLLYFLYICPEIDIKCEKNEFLLQRYLKVLSRTMANLNCRTKAPTMEALKKSMYERRAYAVFSGLILYLRMIADKEDTEDFQELLNHLGGETRMNVFKNANAIRAARKMILYMDKLGYLDP